MPAAALYRVVWNQAEAPAIKSLKGASDAQLVAALGSDTNSGASPPSG
jgi:hypothetical protein